METRETAIQHVTNAIKRGYCKVEQAYVFNKSLHKPPYMCQICCHEFEDLASYNCHIVDDFGVKGFQR
eukprot:9517152-Karenia_brevis.AAC.1